jgi:hypothetical protein
MVRLAFIGLVISVFILLRIMMIATVQPLDDGIRQTMDVERLLLG